MAAIRVTNVSKCYTVRRQRPFLAGELLRALLLRSSKKEEHWALRDINFEVQRGESIAVIGNNGSGKSTLLSLIARTSYPTTGTIEVHGRVGPMLELGAGFHPQLTGAENIFLNASLLGLPPEEIEEGYDSIVAYADIGTFIDAPLHTYSTGMTARLGFAVLAQMNPDVLIVDEALAVGDADFTKKCQRTMLGMLESGKTMFLVSHDMATVKDLCQRAIWIHEGRVRAQGDTDDVVEEYLGRSSEPSGSSAPGP